MDVLSKDTLGNLGILLSDFGCLEDTLLANTIARFVNVCTVIADATTLTQEYRSFAAVHSCVDNGTRDGLDKFLRAACTDPETALHYEFMQDYKGYALSWLIGAFEAFRWSYRRGEVGETGANYLGSNDKAPSRIRPTIPGLKRESLAMWCGCYLGPFRLA
ncbi:hypothetical protein Tco_1195636 [Tanacetum coccineum]